MSAPKDSLFDTEEAIALSMQLTGAAGRARNDGASPYIRFSSGSRSRPEPARAQPAEATAAPVQQDIISLPNDPFQTWEILLKWVRDVTNAKSCFIVDSQGFVLMREGDDLPEDGFEGAGANLGIAVDQLNQMEIDSGDIQVADLMYQNKSMLVIRVKDKEGDFYTLGILEADTLSSENKKQIYRQVRRSLAQMAF